MNATWFFIGYALGGVMAWAGVYFAARIALRKLRRQDKGAAEEHF